MEYLDRSPLRDLHWLGSCSLPKRGVTEFLLEIMRKTWTYVWGFLLGNASMYLPFV